MNRNFGFDSAFLQKLERLALVNRRPMIGPSAGPRRSPRHGASVEFADYRDYSPGDDFRRIDWNAYARFERLFLRLYSAEEMTTLTLFLDHSASMRFGDPSKAETAGRFAAVLAFIALHHYDRVAVAGWGWSARVDRYLPPRSGRAAIPLVWRQIEEILNAAGESAIPNHRGTDFAALRSFAGTHPGRGIAIVLTDLLTDSDWRTGLRALRAVGQEVTVLQILAPEELKPSLRGDWKLSDVESGSTVEVTISPRVLRRYEEALAAHTQEIREFCRRQGMSFLQIPSSIPLEEATLTSLRLAGVVA